MKTKPKLIIFDWDNTLATVSSAFLSSIAFVIKKYNLPEWKIIRKEKGDEAKSLKDNFPLFFGSNSEKAYKEYLEYYTEQAYALIKAADNASFFLEIIQKEKIIPCIVSNKEKSLLIREINKCFPDFEFFRILGNNDVKNKKPSPEPVLKIMEDFSFDLNRENVWLIGDSKKDTECAFNAGCSSILIGEGDLMDDVYINKIKEKSDFYHFENFEKLIDRYQQI